MNTLVFTGTLRGTTTPQFESLREVISRRTRSGIQACHGLALGADKDFHQICREFSVPLFGFPSTLRSKQAILPISDFIQVFPEKYPLDRNRDMIDFAVLSSGSDSLLIACPKGESEEVRSGTWTTVRYARASSITIVFIWPSDGAVEIRDPGNPHYYSKTRLVGVRYESGTEK